LKSNNSGGKNGKGKQQAAAYGIPGGSGLIF
jgi:hypothetical protein